MRIALDKLTIDQEIQIRHGVREENIREYMEVIDQMPAIRVVRTDEGKLLLADGFQRVEAAQRVGRKSLPVSMINGDRKLALEIAATANTEFGFRLSRAERDDGIRRLKKLHPSWSSEAIAAAMHCAPATVAYVMQRDEVRAEIGSRAGLSDKHYSEIGKLPVKQWNDIADVIQHRQLDTQTTELLIRNLRDERLPADFRESLMKGEEDPVIINRDGTFSLPMGTVLRQVQHMTANDPALVLEQCLLMLARLRQFTWTDIHAALDRVRAERLRSELPSYLKFLEEGLQPKFQILEGNSR